MHAGNPLCGIECHRNPDCLAFEIGLDDHGRISVLNNGLAVASVLKRPNLVEQSLPDFTELRRRQRLSHLIGEIRLRGTEIALGQHLDEHYGLRCQAPLGGLRACRLRGNGNQEYKRESNRD